MEMRPESRGAIEHLWRILVERSVDDPPLASALRTFAEAFLEDIADAADPAAGSERPLPGGPVSVAARKSDTSGSIDPVPSRPPDEPVIPATRAVEMLTLGRSDVVQRSSPRVVEQFEESSVADALRDIETRMRMKAEGSRWAATRRRRIREGADFDAEVRPNDEDIIQRARQIPDCYLWMNAPAAPVVDPLELYDTLGECFAVAADASALVRESLDAIDASPAVFEQSLDLAAESQSALRVIIEEIGWPFDPDQRSLFFELRRITSEHQVHIERNMRADHRADPGRVSEVGSRIGELDGELQAHRARNKRQRKLINKIRYEASRIERGEQTFASHADTLLGAIEEVVQTGLPPSNAELRDLLLPVIEELPVDEKTLSPELRQVFRAADLFIAENARPAEDPARQEPTAEVKAVSRLLGGKAVFLIGGERRQKSAEAIKAAFGLSELYWFSVTEHTGNAAFEPYIIRPDVAVVLLAIRWSSHSYGEIRGVCDEHGKLLVRLPGGYSVNQIAHQIMEQCGDRLALEQAGR